MRVRRTATEHYTLIAYRDSRTAVRFTTQGRIGRLFWRAFDGALRTDRATLLGMEPFKQLRVWRKAHALAINTHRVASGMRSSLGSSLRSQMVRAALSIPTNIVEGRGQKTEREFARFLRIALNSGSELQYHLIVARELRMISEQDFVSLSDQATEIRKMIHGLLNRLAVQYPATAAPRSKAGTSE